MALKFALAGNPNCGKTTLFNLLTGSTAHVGNWAGVTIDRREGRYKKGGQDIEIIDLPGIYSLSPYTPEEVIARNYIIDEKPNLIINIVDATNLERNLYLTTQILETGCPVVVALNMMDLVKKQKDAIDINGLQTALGVPVVPVSAVTGEGADQLVQTAVNETTKARPAFSVIATSPLKPVLEQVERIVDSLNTPHPLFRAVKLWKWLY